MKIPKKIKERPWPEEYHAGQQHFSVTLSWPVVDHEKLLVADFVRNRDRRICVSAGTKGDFRLICSKKHNRAAILYKGERSGKRHDLDRAMQGFGTYASGCYPEISEKDEDALARWLNRRETRNHLMPELAAWVREAQEAELLAERDARGELRDEDVSLCPEELPFGLVEYIRRDVLPQDNVLIYKKGNVRGTCYRCREKVKAAHQRFKQHSSVACPNCGRTVWAFLETSESFKANYVQDIVTIQKGTDGKTLFMRQWHLCRDPEAAWENIAGQLEEVVRYAVRGNKAAKWQMEVKENWMMNCRRYRMADWIRVRDLTSTYDGEYYFYLPEDWEEQVRGTSLQYCDLSDYARDAERRKRDRNTVRFLIDWARYPAVEKLWKAGYTQLVHDKIRGTFCNTRYAVKWQKDSLQQALRFPLRLLREAAPEKWDMYRVQKTADVWELVQQGRVREIDVTSLVELPCPIESVERAIGHASVRKICSYIDRIVTEERSSTTDSRSYWGHRVPYRSPQTYRDYLRDCIQLNFDLDDHSILFPKNLHQAHQRTIDMVKHNASKAKKEAFLASIRKHTHLEWEREGFIIRLPTGADELIEEGKHLHHCVGGYVDRVAEGSTIILLIRRKAEPNHPFYTLEWRDGKVIQCRTTHNKSFEQDTSVSEFVNEWVQHVTRKKKKNRSSDEAAQGRSE